MAMQVHFSSILNKCLLPKISLSLVLRVPRRHMEMSFLFYMPRVSGRLSRCHCIDSYLAMGLDVENILDIIWREWS